MLEWDEISNLELHNTNKISLMHQGWDGGEAKYGLFERVEPQSFFIKKKKHLYVLDHFTWRWFALVL